MFNTFRRIQWKLTLSYALVTAGTVFLLAVMLVMTALFFESSGSNGTHTSMYWSKTAFQDNIPYLLKEPEAMQEWLERVQKQGFKITDFQTNTDRTSLKHANRLVNGAPIYVLDPKLNVLAVVPSDPQIIGKPFSRSISKVGMESILTAAQSGDKNYYEQSIGRPDGTYTAAFPLRMNDDAPVSAIVVYQLKMDQSAALDNLEVYGSFLAIIILIMFFIALPMGALFGWWASGSLRRRLNNLSNAAQAWSKGDFSIQPTDKSGDEIGNLTRALNGMAEKLQSHIHTRDELTRIEERNRIARDLHDTVKQQVYAARMQLSAAKNLVETNPQAAAEHIETALQLNRETQQEIKLIIDELRPAALEGRGLAAALTDYIARWQEHTGIKVECTINGDRPLPLDVEQALYRILQESLSNIARHAEADLVELSLAINPEQVNLTVADNGRGFDPAAVTPNSTGLAGMKQRLSEINGTLAIESAVVGGTKVTATVQLDGKSAG